MTTAVKKRTNRAAIRHGLTAGTCPARDIDTKNNQFRRLIEDAVLKAKGSISIADAALISTATRLEKSSMLAQRYLLKKGESLSPEQYLRFLDVTTKSSIDRDKCFDKLGIASQSAGPVDAFAAVYAPAATSPALDVSATTHDVPTPASASPASPSPIAPVPTPPVVPAPVAPITTLAPVAPQPPSAFPPPATEQFPSALPILATIQTPIN